MTISTIRTPRGHFSYLSEGHENDPLVLCLHGFPDHPRGWEILLEELRVAGYWAVAPWLRGYAPSQLDGDFDPDNLALDIQALAHAFSPNKKVHLVGHDWGAVLTWLAVATRPEQFSSAVTLAVPHPMQFFELLLKNPAQLGRSGYMGLFQVPAISDWLVRRRDFAFIDYLWKKWSPGYTPDPEYMAELKSCLRQSMPAPLSYYRQMLSPLLPSVRRLMDPNGPERHVAVPVLSITGENDGCIAPKARVHAGRYMAAPYEQIEIPHAGHFMHLEAPAAVNSAILGWLKTHRT